jgi:8-oxo-dGTP diphosphatase
MPRTQPLLVSAAIIFNSETPSQVLITQRLSSAPVEPGAWEFPGGKVEFCETPEAALVREIKEELDLVVKVASVQSVVSHVYNPGSDPLHVILLCYRCSVTSGKLRCIGVQDARWVSLAQLSQYAFAAADRPVVTQLMTSQALS